MLLQRHQPPGTFPQPTRDLQPATIQRTVFVLPNRPSMAN
jgi:hypothetical protein